MKPLSRFNKALDRGIFYRNPTHLEEAERAVKQSDIVESIKGSRRTKQHEKFLYGPESTTTIMPGIREIRSMSRDTRVGFFRTLLKIRPYIYMLRVSLGEYKSIKELNGRLVNNIGSTHPRSYKETAESIADIFEKHNIVEFVYVIDSAEPNKFHSVAYAFEADQEEYESDECFEPCIEIEYISAH